MLAVDSNNLSLPDTAKQYKSDFALRVSKADLFNEGKVQKVGLVTLHFESGGGCGSSHDTTFPAVLSEKGDGDLTNPTNVRLLKEATGADYLYQNYLDYPSGGRLATYAGNTYFVTYAEPTDHISSTALAGVSKFTINGSKDVCKFQPYRFEITPIAGLENQSVL